MEKHKQRVSVPKVKETLEGKRLQSRLNSLQLSKDRSEDIGDDENANVGHLTNYSRKLKTTLLSSIENRMDSKEESSKDQPVDIHERINRHPYRHLIGTTIDKDSFKKHMSMLYRGTVYSVKFLKGPSEKYLNSKMITLPEPKITRKKFLVLDLDETLIHTVQAKEKSDVVLKLEGLDSLCFNIRPYCLEFLEKMSEHFAIYVFTASTPAYANPIIDHLNKKTKTIQSVLSRPHCMQTRNGFYIKDLRIIKNRGLKDIIMVDNLVHSFGLQIQNGIPILQFVDNPKDDELKHIQSMLLDLKDLQDVRPYLEKRLQLKRISNLSDRDMDI